MKEQDIKLTLQETEQLCRLYMDCRLSVLEETELQYVLGKLPYSSPCIDEVRMLMGHQISQKALKSTKIKKVLERQVCYKRSSFLHNIVSDRNVSIP